MIEIAVATCARRGVAARAAVVLALALLAASCTGGGEPDPGPPPRPTATPSADTTEGITRTSAADLRAMVERSLGEHAMIAAEAIRATIDGSEAAPALREALNAASDGLAGAVDLAYGIEGADTVIALWTHQNELLLERARSGDAAAEQALAEVRNDLGRYLEGISNGVVPGDALASLLAEFHAALDRVADAERDGDPTRSYTEQRQLYAAQLPLAAGLARAFVRSRPDAFAADLDGPVAQVRSHLAQLLVEHAWLLNQTLRRGARAADDFPVAAAALNGNTVDLTAQVERLTNAETGARFDALWRRQIDLAVHDLRGGVAGNEVVRAQARSGLAEWRTAMAALLAESAEFAEPAGGDGVDALLSAHTDAVVAATTAWVAGDARAALQEGRRDAERLAALASAITRAAGA